MSAWYVGQLSPATDVALAGQSGHSEGDEPHFNGPLDLHAQFSKYVMGNTVVALIAVLSSNSLTLIVFTKLSIFNANCRLNCVRPSSNK